jgi:hypothetical protein
MRYAAPGLRPHSVRWAELRNRLGKLRRIASAGLDQGRPGDILSVDRDPPLSPHRNDIVPLVSPSTSILPKKWKRTGLPSLSQPCRMSP